MKNPGCLYPFDGMTEELAKSLVGSDFKHAVMDNILRLAYKRRALIKSDIDAAYMESILQELKDRAEYLLPILCNTFWE